MKTDFQKLEAAVSGSNAAAAIDYATFPNAMPSSQEAAPRLGRAYVASTVGQKEVYACMRELGYQMGEAEAVRVWNALGLIMKDYMRKGYACDLGFVRFSFAISGTFPSADAAFDPARNKLYVVATPSDDIRNALADGTPTRIDGTDNGVRIDNVTWGAGTDKNTVKSGEPIDIHGAGLTLGNGDEHAELQLPDGGGTLPVALETPPDEKGLGQRLVGCLSQPVEACKGATLTVWTHGFDPDADIQKVPSPKLTVLAGDVPPGPSGPTVTAINDGTFHSGAGNVVTGENMRFADELPGDHVLIKNRTGDDMEAMISTDDEVPVTETGFALNIDEGTPLTDGEQYTFEFSMLDAEGEPVTVTQTARWSAS